MHYLTTSYAKYTASNDVKNENSILTLWEMWSNKVQMGKWINSGAKVLALELQDRQNVFVISKSSRKKSSLEFWGAFASFSSVYYICDTFTKMPFFRTIWDVLILISQGPRRICRTSYHHLILLCFKKRKE